MGLEVVEVTFRGGGRSALLRLDVDRAGPVGVTIDECHRMSRALSEALDSMEWIDESYLLEVSSPGTDRPIRTADDFRRNTGRRVVVECGEAVAGRKTIRGLLLGLEGDEVRLEDDGGQDVRIASGSVRKVQQDPAF